MNPIDNVSKFDHPTTSDTKHQEMVEELTWFGET